MINLFSLCACLFAEPKKVLISQVMEHKAFEMTLKGIKDSLEQSKYGKDIEIRIESAQANATLAAQIANKFVNQKPDVVVGIGTISAQSFLKYAKIGKVKLVFSSVTDPLSASIIKSQNKPDNNTSGVSNFIDLEPQLQLFKKLQPNLKRLGFLYNPGEANSISIMNKLETLCPKLGLRLIKQTIAKTADIAQNASNLASTADAIFISNDSTALSGLQSIIKAADKANIPVYVSDTDAVELGALAALGPNQYEVGQQTGQIIIRILNGEDAGLIPVEYPKKTDLFINLEAAKKLQITIPQEIIDQAARIVETNKP